MRVKALISTAVVLCVCVVVAQAEIRTWKAAAGGFTTDAEFVDLKPGDVVRLKTKDGRDLNVPLAQLCADDQAYVRLKAGNTRLGRAQRAADLCRKPDDAIAVYRVFHDDPQSTPEEQAFAAAKIAELKDLAQRKMVRLNKKWVTADEAEQARKKADELMRQGLELIKIGQETEFRRKFGDAAAIEPETVRADFLAGLIYSLMRRSDKALTYFQKCLLTDPDNVAALNNAGLCAAGKGDFAAAAAAWRKALAVQPDQRVVHNVGRFLEQSLRANVNIPKASRDVLALPYAELVASGKFEGTDESVGWLLLLIEESDLDLRFGTDDKKDKRVDPRPTATEDGPVVGGGTGFVVHPGYVLTNAHVATDDGVCEIQLADGRIFKTTRAAVDEQLDLALLKCEELTAPPLRLAPYTVPRGSDVMLLGYPEMFNLGVTLKATRGSISSIPDPQVKNQYLYDAVTNSGNSGGPVCDEKANVVAVHAIGVNTASRYGGGIPSEQALAFLKKSLPDFQPQLPHDAKLDWPAVDEKVSPSTVLIWVRKKSGKPTTAMSSDVVEVPLCLFCGGARDLICANCRNGTIVRDGSSCRACGGDGKIPCRVCKGAGVDMNLATVKGILNSGSGPKSTIPPKTQPPAASKPGVQLLGTGPGADGLQYDMRVPVTPSRRLDDAELSRLMLALDQTDGREIAAAARTLAESIPIPRYREQVAARLERSVNSSANWVAHAACTRALQTWTGQNSVATIGTATRCYNWIVRTQACYSLAFIGDTGGLPALIYHLRKPDDIEQRPPQFDPKAERNMVKTTLIVFGSGARAEIEKLRGDADPEVRAAAEEILKAYEERPNAAAPQNAVSVGQNP